MLCDETLSIHNIGMAELTCSEGQFEGACSEMP